MPDLSLTRIPPRLLATRTVTVLVILAALMVMLVAVITSAHGVVVHYGAMYHGPPRG